MIGGLTPREATLPQFRDRLDAAHTRKVNSVPEQKPSSKFKIGTNVRISLHEKSFKDSFEKKYSDEIFVIEDIINLPIPLYKLKSLTRPNEGPLLGLFYRQELKRVSS